MREGRILARRRQGWPAREVRAALPDATPARAVPAALAVASSPSGPAASAAPAGRHRRRSPTFPAIQSSSIPRSRRVRPHCSVRRARRQRALHHLAGTIDADAAQLAAAALRLPALAEREPIRGDGDRARLRSLAARLHARSQLHARQGALGQVADVGQRHADHRDGQGARSVRVRDRDDAGVRGGAHDVRGRPGRRARQDRRTGRSPTAWVRSRDSASAKKGSRTCSFPSQVVARDPAKETCIGCHAATPDGNAVGFALGQGLLPRQHRRHPHGLGRDGPAVCHVNGARRTPQARGDADLLAGALERRAIASSSSATPAT